MVSGSVQSQPKSAEPASLRVSLSQLYYPEVRIDTERTKAGLVGVTPRAAAQATLEATLGNINSPSVWVDGSNGQSYYVVTSLDGKVMRDPAALTTVPLRISETGQAVTLGAYGAPNIPVGHPSQSQVVVGGAHGFVAPALAGGAAVVRTIVERVEVAP